MGAAAQKQSSRASRGILGCLSYEVRLRSEEISDLHLESVSTEGVRTGAIGLGIFAQHNIVANTQLNVAEQLNTGADVPTHVHILALESVGNTAFGNVCYAPLAIANIEAKLRTGGSINGCNRTQSQSIAEVNGHFHTAKSFRSVVCQAQAALAVEQGYIATKTEEVEVHLRPNIETITILRVCKLLQVLAHTELTQIHTGFETKFNAGFGRLRNAERQHYSKNQKRLFRNAVYIKFTCLGEDVVTLNPIVGDTG